jgi:hypothetical protein
MKKKKTETSQPLDYTTLSRYELNSAKKELMRLAKQVSHPGMISEYNRRIKQIDDLLANPNLI